jgi:AraC-like DNA-binding protein
MSDLPGCLLAMPPRIIHANAYPFQSRERIPTSGSESLHLFAILRGTGQLQISGTTWPLAAGTIAVAPWGHPWTFQSAARPALALISVHLQFLPWSAPTPALRCWLHGRDRASAPPPDQPDLGCGVVHPANAPQVLELAQAAAAAWDAAGDPGRELRLRALALDLLAELLPRPAAGAPAHAAARQVRELTDWLRFAPLSGITRSDLEQRCGRRRSAFGAAFKAVTGLPPAAFLMRRRLQEAHRLLCTTDLPISAIAARVGFADAFHFSRNFRTWHGCSPRQARQRG